MDRIIPTFILIISIILGTYSCNTQSKGEATSEGDPESLIQLEKEVIAIHDEVMPKMGQIAQLKGELEEEAQNAALDSALRTRIGETIGSLVLADSLMWDWMHHYEKPANAPVDSIRMYLETEKHRIHHVSDKMLESIRNAEELLQKLGHAQPH